MRRSIGSLVLVLMFAAGGAAYAQSGGGSAGGAAGGAAGSAGATTGGAGVGGAGVGGAGTTGTTGGTAGSLGAGSLGSGTAPAPNPASPTVNGALPRSNAPGALTAPVPNPGTAGSTGSVTTGGNRNAGVSSGGPAAPAVKPNARERDRELEQKSHDIDQKLLDGGICDGCQ